MSHRSLRLTVIAIVVWLLYTTFVCSHVYAAQPPVARIVSVDYPRHVLSGGTFSVTVVADYSDKVGVEVGIWDVQTGVIQSISFPLREHRKGELDVQIDCSGQDGGLGPTCNRKDLVAGRMVSRPG